MKKYCFYITWMEFEKSNLLDFNYLEDAEKQRAFLQEHGWEVSDIYICEFTKIDSDHKPPKRSRWMKNWY